MLNENTGELKYLRGGNSYSGFTCSQNTKLESCKEYYLSTLYNSKATTFHFIYQINPNRIEGNEIVKYIHSIEDRLNISHSKIVVQKNTKRFVILEVTPNRRWFYNKILLSILLESFKGSWRKYSPDKLINAIGKYGISSYLEKKNPTNRDLTQSMYTNQGYDYYLCNVLNGDIDSDGYPLTNNAKCFIKSKYHKGE